jgi:hypothetical protein
MHGDAEDARCIIFADGEVTLFINGDVREILTFSM